MVIILFQIYFPVMDYIPNFIWQSVSIIEVYYIVHHIDSVHAGRRNISGGEYHISILLWLDEQPENLGTYIHSPLWIHVVSLWRIIWEYLTV